MSLWWIPAGIGGGCLALLPAWMIVSSYLDIKADYPKWHESIPIAKFGHILSFLSCVCLSVFATGGMIVILGGRIGLVQKLSNSLSISEKFGLIGLFIISLIMALVGTMFMSRSRIK